MKHIESISKVYLALIIFILATIITFFSEQLWSITEISLFILFFSLFANIIIEKKYVFLNIFFLLLSLFILFFIFYYNHFSLCPKEIYIVFTTTFLPLFALLFFYIGIIIKRKKGIENRVNT